MPKVARQLRPAPRPGLPPPEQRNPLRCHRMKVSGLTTRSVLRQSNSPPRADITNRTASVARCGCALRSSNSASCLRRKRFSAANAARDRRHSARKRPRSARTERLVVAACAKGHDSAVGDHHEGSGSHMARPSQVIEKTTERNICALQAMKPQDVVWSKNSISLKTLNNCQAGFEGAMLALRGDSFVM